MKKVLIMLAVGLGLCTSPVFAQSCETHTPKLLQRLEFVRELQTYSYMTAAYELDSLDEGSFNYLTDPKNQSVTQSILSTMASLNESIIQIDKTIGDLGGEVLFDHDNTEGSQSDTDSTQVNP